MLALEVAELVLPLGEEVEPFALRVPAVFSTLAEGFVLSRLTTLPLDLLSTRAVEFLLLLLLFWYLVPFL